MTFALSPHTHSYIYTLFYDNELIATTTATTTTSTIITTIAPSLMIAIAIAGAT
jgi:hypothetical protein